MQTNNCSFVWQDLEFRAVEQSCGGDFICSPSILLEPDGMVQLCSRLSDSMQRVLLDLRHCSLSLLSQEDGLSARIELERGEGARPGTPTISSSAIQRAKSVKMTCSKGKAMRTPRPSRIYLTLSNSGSITQNQEAQISKGFHERVHVRGRYSDGP